ncbi:MAG: 7-cyano-7-deazaguanine synthase QueC [Candidatus Helarchaeota archaeon]|nr:7-cyano-7-deazaguanine synthase QueC [Candidatus Helarchaeota archaeon]
MRKAVCLLSGGLDSSTVIYYAKNQGYEVYALSFDYGQRHKKELDAAKNIASSVGAKEHKILKVDLTQIGGSALTDQNIEVPIDREIEEMTSEIPITYVPMRNTIFLAFAAAYAEVIGADTIFAGMNFIDYSGYPDCRPEYVNAMQKAIKLGSKAQNIKIETPIIRMDKREIIQLGSKLSVPYKKTWSCYKGGKKACGQCDSCLLRIKGFEDAGLIDPIEYQK